MVPLFIHYMRWHYTRAVRDLVNIVINFLWFFYEFFSIPLLIKTLFVPFHRIEEHARSGLDFGAMGEAFLVNTLMRFVGALLRTFIIIIGMFFLMLTLVVGLGMLVLWLASPAIVVFLVASGIIFLGI